MNIIPKHILKRIHLLRPRNLYFWVFIDVMIDDVIGKSNLFQCLCTRDDNLSRPEYTRRDLLHVLRWFEFNLDGGIPVWFKGDIEMFFEMSRHFYKVNVIVETEI